MIKLFLPVCASAALFYFSGCKSFPLPYDKNLRLTQLLGQTVPAAANINFKFDQAEKRVTGNAGCNTFSADYTLKGSKLNIGQSMATKMTCLHQDWEDKFLGMLPQVKSVKQAGNKIQLLGEGGKTLAALSE
jgi:heat shock protein HslJ